MFCKLVWNGLHTNPNGDIRLCAIGNNSDPKLDMQTARDKDGNIMNILTHSLEDILNSDKHREVRLTNVNNPEDWSPHCSCCENREVLTNFDKKHPNKSRRIYLMNKVDTDDVVNENNFKEKIESDGSVRWGIGSLDIRFGNLCNQKCVMCSPTFSNLWYEEWVNWSNKTSFSHAGTQTINLQKNKHGKWETPKDMLWYEDPRWWPKFREMMPTLKHIYVTGGEPMIVPAHDEMLDILIESGYAKNIFLEYDSNCSAINDKIISRWSHFKKVEIRASMDSIKEEYELIRFGGKWDKFVDNLQHLKLVEKETNQQIKLLSATTCFQNSTAYSILDSEEWCKSIGVDFHIRFLEGPKYHCVDYLPREAKLELLEYYNKSNSEKALMISKYLTSKSADSYTNLDHVKEYVRFMDFLDSSRKTDWKSVLPKIHNLLKNHV